MNIYLFVFFFYLKWINKQTYLLSWKSSKHNLQTLQIIKGEKKKIQGNEFSKLAPEHIRSLKIY